MKVKCSPKAIPDEIVLYGDLYEIIAFQYKAMMSNIEKILHSFFDENMDLMGLTSTCKVLNDKLIIFNVDAYSEMFLPFGENVFNTYKGIKTRGAMPRFEPIKSELETSWIIGYYQTCRAEIDQLVQEENWMPGEIDDITVNRLNKMLTWNRKEVNIFVGFI